MGKILFVATMCVAFSMVVWQVAPAQAAPLALSCTAPGYTNPRTFPPRAELTVTFQRFFGQTTQTVLRFYDFSTPKDFLDGLAKAINQEAAQRPPKMAAIRERGLDQLKLLGVVGPIIIITLEELVSMLLVYDPEQLRIDFQGPDGYIPICSQLAPVRDVPNFAEVKFESRPRLLFAGMPERVRSGQSVYAVVAFTDLEDDVQQARMRYRSRDGSIAALTTVQLPVSSFPSPYAPGLKGIRFQVQINCQPPLPIPGASTLAMDAEFTVIDQTGKESEPFKVAFTCER